MSQSCGEAQPEESAPVTQEAVATAPEAQRRDDFLTYS